jgi:NAD(P)-dependent dehydrogenase (short-subunit alcohol dehydrogenase family)
MRRLAGEISVITGAGSGIGRATAKTFAEEGAHIVIIDRDETTAREVEQEIRGRGSEVVVRIVDLADGRKAEQTITEIGSLFGGLDILVNNAATFIAKSFDETTPEEWQKVLNVNLTAYFLCARSAAREMRRRGGGSIVNVGSVHRLISEPNSGAYAASKGGVAQLTRNLAIEFGAANIIVNSVSPGFVRTRMSIVNGVDETTTQHFMDYYLTSGRIPLRRAGLPEDIAAAVLFLASRECGYLTGADLIVDGGLTITL